MRITTTDSVLHGLVAPALRGLEATHPLLTFELHTGNALASLTRRDANIAVRATRQPPEHLVGQRIGPIRMALFAAAQHTTVRSYDDVLSGHARWIGPDDALPDHPSVIWRQRQFPQVLPHYKVNSLLTVMDLVALGAGVGVLPLFLAEGRAGLRQLTDAIAECQTDLWLLTHPETRHLRRVSTVFKHLGATLALG